MVEWESQSSPWRNAITPLPFKLNFGWNFDDASKGLILRKDTNLLRLILTAPAAVQLACGCGIDVQSTETLSVPLLGVFVEVL